MSAALIGSGVGLSLGAAYLAGGMAQHAANHSRAERIAQAAAGGYSDAVLRQEAATLGPAALRLAQAHDPFATESSQQRRLTELSQRLERREKHSSELDCLAQAVYYEARGESPKGQFAVAQVVMNRVRHPAFPMTVCDVVFQGAGRAGCQFSFACDGSMRRGHREASAWNRARQVASRVLAGAAIAEVGSATHFHTTAVAPAWGPQMRRVAQVGMHVFYKFNPRKARSAPAPMAPAVQHAVMTAGPEAPASGLRLTAAMVEPAAEPAPQATPAAAAQASDPEAVTGS